MRVMYDSIVVANLPHNAGMVAGYVDGHWPTFPALTTAFPNAVRVSIATSPDSAAMVLDVEQGDATPAQAVGWVVNQRNTGRDPTVYCNTSTWPAVKAQFAARGVPLPHWWRADYNGRAQLEMGEIAHQYVDIGPYDISAVADHWPGVDPAAPTAVGADMFELVHNTVTNQIVAWSSGGAWWPVPNTDWAQVALADSVLCAGQRDVGQAEWDLLKAVAASARAAS